MKKTFNIFYLSLIISVMLFSCRTRVVITPDDTIIVDNSNPVEQAEVIEDTLIMIQEEIDTIIPELPVKKDLYRLAVILPFMEDSVRAAWEDSKAKNFQNFKSTFESEVAASFYEGFSLSLKETKFNSRFQIKVFDTENDLSKTKEIVEQLKEDSFDMIFGAYNKNNLWELSKFALKNDIPLISPFSPSKSASSNHPNYVMLEPSLDQHVLTMLAYAIDSMENPHIKFFYEDSRIGSFNAELMSSTIDSLNTDLSVEDQINYSIIKLVQDDFELEQYCDKDVHNVIIFNSFNEDFIHVFLRQLEALNKDYNSTVFGMPGWENSPIVRLEYLTSSEVHFTTNTWLDSESDLSHDFKIQYKLRFKKNPDVYALLGRDVVTILVDALDKEGSHWSKTIVENEYQGLAKNYNFKPIYSLEGNTLRIENSNIRIYKIEDYQKVLVK